jgi:hypothetical protein
MLGGSGTINASTINAGSFNWSGSSIGTPSATGPGTTLIASCTSFFTGSSYQDLACGSTVNRNGITTRSSGDRAIEIHGSSTPGCISSSLNIAAGTTFDDQSYYAHRINSCGVVNNAGTYAKSGSGFTHAQTTFNNSGAIEVRQGGARQSSCPVERHS